MKSTNALIQAQIARSEPRLKKTKAELLELTAFFDELEEMDERDELEAELAEDKRSNRSGKRFLMRRQLNRVG